MATKTAPYDSAEYLTTPEAQAEYLSLAMAEGDAAEIRRALGVVARARGMTQLSRDAGIGREALYKALGDSGNPEFGTILRVLGALGMRISVQPAPKEAA